MPYREKVIEILEKAKTVIEKWIPMFEQYNTPAGIDDAIALLKKQEEQIKNRDESLEKAWEEIKLLRGMLKEQEAVKPIKMQRMDNNFSFFVPYFLCGNCRYELEGKDVMFCAHCGRPVKWDD